MIALMLVIAIRRHKAAFRRKIHVEYLLMVKFNRLSVYFSDIDALKC